MIYRHFNAPARAFSQFSHELIRHPRLSSDAVRLLTWQLSLPRDARESLSRTAERARIGACAFARAKRQLKEEGFVHERRVQGAGGLWVTQQLVSSTPLTTDQAVKLLARGPVASSQVTPSPRNPAVGALTVGEPTPPSTGGHPKKDRGENTSHLPPDPAEAPEVADPDDESPRLEEARALIGALPLLSATLRSIPPGMRDELARLAARWLDTGHSSTDVHEHILRGLPGTATPVHRPGGLVRYLLRDVPPRSLPPQSSPSSGNRLSPRLEGARECAGDHTQPMLFRPLGGETHCPECASLS
ncbi:MULTISPECIES: hypothetical protein [unclassified Streptomyces]|uniref:hypothetical protein n=1 Tax=unclassified Streptomyces TaxID=2593676 RepID=UPI0006F37AA3|nr:MULTISPECIES: hypothetical protein [unclassified Streptomyces]KQX52753.1 hypothetical protein ASD33_05625 [Streptomyces sp. Root1304]KRA89668.1 hypothetical protein ASE09_05630 [Streptomyces sp. Root66D1]